MSKKWKRGLQVGSQVAISFNYNRYRKYEITTVKSVTEEDGDIKVEVDFAEFYEDSCNIIPITEEIIKIVEAVSIPIYPNLTKDETEDVASIIANSKEDGIK